MGEIADMMLEGALCEVCGEYLGDDVGFARQCESCAADSRADGQIMRPDGMGAYQRVAQSDRALGETRDGFVHDKLGRPMYRPTKTNCPDCGKLVKKTGLDDHRRVVHGQS